MRLREVSSGQGNDGDQSAEVDIVAIHGLNPWNDQDHALNTWRKPKTAAGMLWLCDYLPKSTPNARILIYEYNSNPVFATSKERFVHQANDLLERLHIARDMDHERPLIIIAHSLGGILAKQALVNASNNPRYKRIYKATSGLAFFGTPHAGGSDALVKLGNASIRVVRGLFLNPPNDIMQAVTHGSLYADVLQENWRHQLNLYKIVSFYEGIGEIVPRESATIGLPGDVENIVCINADHSNICSFDLSNVDDEDNFELVRANIKELYENAIKAKSDLSLKLPNVPTANPRDPYSNLKEAQASPDQVGIHPPSMQPPMTANSYINIRNLFPYGVGASTSGHEKMRLTKRILQHVPEIGRLFTVDYTETFYTYEYDKEYDIKVDERYRGTCEWLCRHEDYRWWCSTTTPCLLWLSGTAGLGKTTLLTHVVCQLKKTSARKEFVLFSFCEANVNDRGADIVSVLIHQLLTNFPSLRRYASQRVEEYYMSNIDLGKPTPERMPVGRLWRLLCDLIRISKLHKVYVVIDALDECKGSSQIELIHLFKGAIPSVRILVSSRPNEGLRIEFSKWLALSPSTFRNLNADDEDTNIRVDIEHYLMGETQRVGGLRGYSSYQKDKIKDHLREYCSGIFLLAKLMVERLEKAQVSDLDATLKETPSDLQILYGTLLSEIPVSIRAKRCEIFKILMYTCEPLNVRELAFASLSWPSSASNVHPPLIDDDYIEGFRKDLLLYGPLLRIRREDGVVSFIHPSVKEFLVRISKEPRGPYAQFLVKPGLAQQEIAMACLRLLLSKSDLKVPAHWESRYIAVTASVVGEQVLLDYALQHWYRHLMDAMQATETFDSIDPELICLVQSLGKLWRAPDKVNYRDLIMKSCGLHPTRSRSRISVFEFFSWLGLTSFIIRLLEEERHTPFVPRLEDSVESALRLAIKGGHTATVLAITEHFNITSLEDPGYEGIIADAAWSGRSGLVTRLQRMRSSNPSEFGEATTAAIITGSHSVLQSLVEDVASFQKRDKFGMTVLHRIFFDNFTSEDWKSTLATASFHIRNGVAVGARDVFGNTALHYASYVPGLGTAELLKGLIQEGADPTATNEFLWTPLHLAARRARSFDALKTLLRTGGSAMIGSRTRGGSTPLHWATDRYGDDYDVIRQMLLCGADPHAATLKGVTPMDQASRRPWMLGIFQSVYTRLDGVNHVPLCWDDADDEVPQDRALLSNVDGEHEGASENYHEGFYAGPRGDEQSFVTASRGDSVSFVTASSGDGVSIMTVTEGGIGPAQDFLNPNMQVKTRKSMFFKRLLWWR